MVTKLELRSDVAPEGVLGHADARMTSGAELCGADHPGELSHAELGRQRDPAPAIESASRLVICRSEQLMRHSITRIFELNVQLKRGEKEEALRLPKFPP